MLEALKNLIRGATPEETRISGYVADDLQLAQAALMFHVIAVDGIVTSDETKRLADLLSEKFGLESSDTAALIEEARRADSEAIDLYAFTRTLKRETTMEQRSELIRDLWEMVYADGVVHELEDNIVWRAAELLDIDSRQRMEIKQAVSGAVSED